MRVLLIAILAFVLAPASTAVAQEDILVQLKKLPGMTVVSESSAPGGHRFFLLDYLQPADHDNPSAGSFTQRIQLLHKETTRPMVVHTSGYAMRTTPFEAEPTVLLDGNQISVEARFFQPSRPQPADWRHLTIRQAAADHHRIIMAFKQIYGGRWISTGSSKGGMASVYHRRFYPADVDGLVAYVAPNDRDNNDDRAYDTFFATVGTPACRAALNTLQHEALRRRAELVPKFEAWAAASGYTFAQLHGTVDRAFEFTVLDTVWSFWQSHGSSYCDRVPGVTASTDEVYRFIDAISGWSSYTDQGAMPFVPYSYQAATQLGWPSLKFEHLRDVMHYEPSFYGANSNLPPHLRSTHDPHAMIDIDTWVRTRSSRMLFVYGQNDPWGAEPFLPSKDDSYSYVTPGANHVTASISNLGPSEKSAATQALRRWAR
ncbi:aminopeptidase [Kibdelosporangium philippinense]|uniref:Aminopeptidase n=1 Tax=Kibdelosporangium philippinense TaxID=211113 RepID=A0ABS8ZM46_9PSEU|nr:S28 family serine protease [Kibdelosporangium philippinense]MCE7007691.1 aminopeptidase [Kibdelosporangium philippinense]